VTGKTSPAIGGIDLGATKILSVVVSDSGKLLAEDLRPTRGADRLRERRRHLSA